MRIPNANFKTENFEALPVSPIDPALEIFATR
jgi:hypothetical protein